MSVVRGCHVTLAALAGVFVLGVAPADVAGPSAGRAALAAVFAAIEERDAEALDGKRATLRVELDSLPEDFGRYIGYDCAGPDDLHRTLFLHAGERVGASGRLTVEGRLRVVRHPVRPQDAGLFKPFIELRIEDARTVSVEPG